VAKVLRADVERALAEGELGTSEFGVLVALDDLGLLSQQQLADRLDADKSHVVRLIDQLERRGLVARTADPIDRRRHSIQLRPAGRRLLRHIGPIVEQAEAEGLSTLSSAQQHTLADLLQRVLDSHDRSRAGPSP
jgi:DNA-binding MarR family transcriptional regulator